MTILEKGVAAHLGNYTETATLNVLPEGLAGSVEITAANGDKLLGAMFELPSQLGVTITDGTGRFKGAKGSYIETLTGTGTTSFTVVAAGRVSTVGWNQ